MTRSVGMRAALEVAASRLHDKWALAAEVSALELNGHGERALSNAES